MRDLRHPRSLRRSALLGVALAGLVWLAGAMPARAQNRICPPFHLRNDAGEIINPLTGAHDDEPYSPRQTCGACHDYDTITQGYHFQQGWDEISDDFNPEMPWVLSRGMVGKM
ncbi:MAG: hypothetical protein GF330_06295 [Candidatus Eisenbacteria bacterium]|nr:hypothetical protein [Candidatus Eisenbacteria bacterium]